jgi:hypothetical protein
MTICGACGGRGSRVVAAISDTHWTDDRNGRPTLTHSFAIPIVVPCLCLAERAAAAAPKDRLAAGCRQAARTVGKVAPG